jgi:hypothetical protein
VGILERESIEAHLESYQEGYEDGYKRGWNERAETEREARGARLAKAGFRPGGVELARQRLGFAGGPFGEDRRAKKLSRWNRYVKKKANRIYLKGKKNKLNFKLMGKKYRRKYGIKK